MLRLAIAAILVAAPASATTLKISVSNPAPMGGFSLTPVYTAFTDGRFDAFDEGGLATPGVGLLAELGDVSGLPLERLAVSPGSQATVVAAGAIPPIEPGETGSAIIDIADPALNRYMTFLSMIVPTNDTFIGNDNPLAIQVFGDMGAYLGDQVIQVTADWAFDAGTEANDPADGPAFVQGVDATLGTPTNDPIGPAESQAAFAGITGANGQVLDAGAIDVFGAGSEAVLAEIEIALVPVPAALPLLAGGMGLLALAACRRRS